MTEPRVLITGASAGLGAEFARQLAAKSRDLILVARRIEPMQQLATRLIDDFNVKVDFLQSDLSVPGAPARIHEQVAERGLVVDYLINNAGSHGPDLLLSRDWPDQQRYIELMITSAAAMCHYFLPDMCKHGSGRVINVASVAGLISLGGDYSYGPTKSYLVALSRSLALSLREQDVRVMALCPGFTHTEFHASKQMQDFKAGTPEFLWYDADVVVREGLAAIERGCSTYTSGRLYRWGVPLFGTAVGRWLLARLGVRRRGTI